MKRLVVVADDFGLCQSVNEGVMHSYVEGIVTELSLMLGSPGTDDAIELAKSENIHEVGLHCLLTFWKDNGKITRRDDYRKLFDELSQEAIGQLFHKEIELFINKVGRKPSHLTSQYGIHGHDKLLPVVLEYCRTERVPIRLPHTPFVSSLEQIDISPNNLRENEIKTTDARASFEIGDEITVRNSILKKLARVNESESFELLFHPGIVSKELAVLSSMVYERERDLSLATDGSLEIEIKNLGFNVVTYSEAVDFT